MTRGILTDLTFQDALELDALPSIAGSALTMVSTDIETAALGLEDMHEIWANILQLGLSIWLLELRISWACVAPVMIAFGELHRILCRDVTDVKHIVSVIVSSALSPWMSGLMKTWNEAIQTRLGSTLDTLNQIKQIKLLSQADRMLSYTQSLRTLEVRASARWRGVLSIVVICCKSGDVSLSFLDLLLSAEY